MSGAVLMPANPGTSSGGGITPPAGDIGGTTSSPTVVSTHLSSALPVNQGGTGQTTAATAYNALSPMTTTGDMEYESGTNTAARLAGNTSGTKNYLTMTSSVPSWGTIAVGDVPTLNQNTTGSSGSCTGNAATATNLAGGATLPGYLAPAVVTLTDASTVTVNAASGNDFRLTMTSGVGSTRQIGSPSNPVDGQKIIIQVTQDSSGSQLLTYTSAWEFSTSLASPTLSTSPNLTDILGFVYNAAKSKWLFVAFVSGFS